jgi:hypothetical protein
LNEAAEAQISHPENETANPNPGMLTTHRIANFRDVNLSGLIA